MDLMARYSKITNSFIVSNNHNYSYNEDDSYKNFLDINFQII